MLDNEEKLYNLLIFHKINFKRVLPLLYSIINKIKFLTIYWTIYGSVIIPVPVTVTSLFNTIAGLKYTLLLESNSSSFIAPVSSTV